LKDSAGNYTGAVGYFQRYEPFTENGKKAQARIDELEAQLAEWKDIGTPIYEHLPGLSYVRVVGRLDGDRLKQVTSNLLTHMRAYRTVVVRIDLSAALIDDPAGVASELLKMIRSVRLLGAESILTGMETRLVLAMEPMVGDVSLIKSFGSMDAAFEAALSIIGYEIRKKQQS
jgi:rsbT co-antagonist protein RsbR